MTVNQIVEDICGAIDYDTTDSTQSAQALRWANDVMVDMAAQHDWPELITRNATVTWTTGESVDLTATLPTLMRIIDKSVRYSDYNLRLTPKGSLDQYDPSRIDGSDPFAYDMPRRTEFRVFPAPSTGAVITFDWLAYPTAIVAGGAETSISFLPDHHNLIVDGGIWHGERYIGDDAWRQHKGQWLADCLYTIRKAYAVRPKSHIITPIKF